MSPPRGLLILYCWLRCGALPGRQYCWGEVADSALTPELCCGADADLEKCMFDRHYFTQFECCQSGWAILDPYPLVHSPPIAFPSDPNDWSQQHPADSAEQKDWEQLMYFAARTKEVKLSNGMEIRINVFKGDMPDIHLYDLDAESSQGQPFDRIAAARIVDVGANYGGVAVALARHFAAAQLVVLEPNPLLCRFLLWNIRMHALTHRIWPLCAALGDKDLLLQPCKQPWVGAPVNSCMNLAMRTFQGDDDGEVVKVPALSFRQLLQGMAWQSFELLKLDCEGCEWPLSQIHPLPSKRAVGELHFDCGERACWPPQAKQSRPGNCSHVEQFSSLQEMWDLAARCT